LEGFGMRALFTQSIRRLRRAPFNELKKRARILVIDDEECSFPFELLRKEDYAIDHWPEVRDLRTLEDGIYDIIILDIKGVARDYDRNDGLGILEHLKKVNPSQIIIAFSGQSFDLSKNRFWKLADDALAKPVDVTTCKQVIDRLIERKMTFQHYWQGVENILLHEGVPNRDVRRLEKRVFRALKRRDKDAACDALRGALDKVELAMRLVAIGVKLYALVP
jgi:CheY-like chemotaxis protein